MNCFGCRDEGLGKSSSYLRIWVSETAVMPYLVLIYEDEGATSLFYEGNFVLYGGREVSIQLSWHGFENVASP